MAVIPGSVRVGGFIAPTDSTDTYAVTDPTYGRGGLRSVANIAARNAITKDRRVGQLGMEVVTIDTMNLYRLINEPGTAGTTDTDWELMESNDLWNKVGDVLSPTTSGDIVNPDAITYTNATPTPVTIGGIPAGSTFTDEPHDDLLTSLLYPYQYPAFTSFSISGQATTIEVGASISGAHTFIWATSNSGNVATNSINIYDITGSATLFTGLANDGSEAYSFPSPIQLVTQDSYVWQIEGTNTNTPPTTFNRNFTVNWQWLTHWGSNVNTSLTNAQILALAGSQLRTTFPPQVTFAGGGYFWYWIPSSFAQPTIFKDHATGFAIGMEAAVTQSVTNAYSIATNYKGYRSTNSLVSALTIDIS